MKSQSLWLINYKTKSGIKNNIIKIFLCCITACLAAPSHADSRIDKMRNEFFKQKEPVPANNKNSVQTSPAKEIFQIQSISQATMPDYVYDEGPGTRQVRSVDVKIKISGNKDIRIPILYVYLYDKDKKLIDRLERIYMKVGADTKEMDMNSFLFKPRKTYVLMFDYPNELNFKYFMAVVGNKKRVAAEVKPGNVSPSDFDFEEKAQYLKQ
jgi:hypothetical protein